MSRFACFVLLSCLLPASAALAQSSAPAPIQVPPAAAQASQDDLAAAEAAISASNWTAAEAKLNAWLTAHPTDARALFDSGYVADTQNRLDAAASFYRRAIQANPQSFEAHLSLGLLLARQNKADEARPELAAATALDPGEAGPALKARAWRALAQIDRAQDPTAASNDLLEALKLAPETVDDTLLAAELAEKSGQNDAAEAAYRRILAKDPDSAPANAGLAHLFIDRKQYAQAETMLRAALAKAPDDPTLTTQLATVLADQDKAEALPLFQKLHAGHPENRDITRMLAAVLSDAGDYAASDKLYLQLLADAPDNTSLLAEHAENLLHQAQYAQAFTIFSKVTQLDPANGGAWTDLAFAAMRTSRPDIAVHAMTMRSRVLPENASSYFLWATAYDALHQKEQAIAYYRHFLDAAAGKFPNQEWQARQRLQILQR